MKSVTSFKDSFKKGFGIGIGIAAAIITTSLLAVVVNFPKIWMNGEMLTSTDLNANFNEIKTKVDSIGQVVVVSGAFTTTAATEYVGFNDNTFSPTQSQKQYKFEKQAIIKNFRVSVNGMSTANTTLTILVNGFTTGAAVTFPIGTAGVYYAPPGSDVLFNAGDMFSIEKSPSNTPGIIFIEYEVVYQ